MRAFRTSFVVGTALAVGFSLDALGEQKQPLPRPTMETAARLQTPLTELMTTYPGVQVMRVADSVRCLYGVPMTAAATPEAAVDSFWAAHSGAFGIASLELIPAWSNDVNWQKFTVFAYRQSIEGLPVEYSLGRVLVLNGSPNRVVYAAGIFVPPPVGGFAADTVGAETAMQSVQTMLPYRQLTQWSQPELVIYAGTEAEMGSGPGQFGPAIRAWKFIGDNGIAANRVRQTFFVNAADGRLVAARNEIYHTDVSGTVQGKATPGVRPDVAGNPATLQPMPEIRVAITGGGNAFSDDLNAFNRVMNLGHELARWFERELGSTQCSALTGCDFASRADVRRYIATDGTTRCTEIARRVAARVAGMVERSPEA